MKKITTLFVLFFLCQNLMAQNKHQLFVFEEVRNELKTENSLYITPELSLWKQNSDNKLIESKIDETMNYRLSKSQNRYILFKNLTTQEIYHNYHLISKTFYVKDSLSNMKWILLDSTEVILGYKCQLAKTKFRGREYFASFTTEIDIQNGPWKFHGLPGMILKVISNDHYEDYRMECIEMKYHTENIENAYKDFINKNSFITWEQLKGEFVRLMDNTFKRMLSSDETTESGGTIKLKMRNKKEVISEAYQLQGIVKSTN